MFFTALMSSVLVLTQLLFWNLTLSAILLISWTEASAASAPPQTLQGRWKECRPPPPATPLSLVSRIYLQSDHTQTE